MFLLLRRIRELKRSNLPISTLYPKFIQSILSRRRNDDNEIQLASIKGPKEAKPNTSALVSAFQRGMSNRDDLRMDFSFSGMSLQLPTGKKVLQGVTGEIKAGRMTAIMGPSGAGSNNLLHNTT